MISHIPPIQMIFGTASGMIFRVFTIIKHFHMHVSRSIEPYHLHGSRRWILGVSHVGSLGTDRSWGAVRALASNVSYCDLSWRLRTIAQVTFNEMPILPFKRCLCLIKFLQVWIQSVSPPGQFS
jgi:hypothetical protein